MHRILFEVGPFTVYTYGFMMAVSFLAGIWISGRRAPAQGFSRDNIYDAALPVLLFSLAGAKITYVLTSLDEVSFHWRDWFALVRGGFVLYGGIAGGALGAIWWMRRKGLPVLGLGDICAPGLAISQAIGRLGCWLNGCCYGSPVDWGVVIPGLGDGVPRHPAQLYEAAGGFAIGITLLFVSPSPVRGRIFAVFLLAYGVLRFGLEFLRADPRGPTLAGLSVSQVLSLLALGIGAVLLSRTFRRTRGS